MTKKSVCLAKQQKTKQKKNKKSKTNKKKIKQKKLNPFGSLAFNKYNNIYTR